MLVINPDDAALQPSRYRILLTFCNYPRPSALCGGLGRAVVPRSESAKEDPSFPEEKEAKRLLCLVFAEWSRAIPEGVWPRLLQQRENKSLLLLSFRKEELSYVFIAAASARLSIFPAVLLGNSSTI
jgi:hypothetical protein